MRKIIEVGREESAREARPIMHHDGSGTLGPRIERVNAKIGILERRCDWLRTRLAEPGRNDRQQSFDRAEVEALEAACSALRYHRQSLDADTDPVLSLAEILDAVEESGPALSDRIESAIIRARRVLRDLSPD